MILRHICCFMIFIFSTKLNRCTGCLWFLLHTNHIHEYFLTTRPPSFKETHLSLLTGAESLKLPVCVCVCVKKKDSLVTKLQSVTHTSAYLCSWTDSSHGIKCTCKQWWSLCLKVKLHWRSNIHAYTHTHTHTRTHTQRPVLPALASCLPRQHFLC